MTPRKFKLTKKLRQKTNLAESRKKKIAVLRSKNLRLRKKNAELGAIIENLKSERYLNQESADLLSSLNLTKTDFLNPTKSKFSPEVRKFALNLHFISPRAYNFVRDNFNTCLPHTRTLARWYKNIDGEPGFSTESLEALKLMFKNKKDPSKKVLCCLCFDEMALRRCVEWDGKKFTGFVNCGQKANEGDNLPVAKEALVFMLTCINGSWKFPIGYFLVDGVTAEQKAELVKLCIDLVSECGIDIITLTFDGCPANFSMAKILGCKLDSEHINPVFTHKGRKVAIFPDPSHMLKLIRNTLGDKGILRDGTGKSVSWQFIQLLVELQENEGCHLANKLRAAHVNYKKQIMKVKLAAQLFSESVAVAIEYCKEELKLEEFQNSKGTIDFLRNFNNLFDLLNSRNLRAYGFKKPLGLNNFDQNFSFLNNMSDYIKSIKLGSSCILDTNRKTGFLGFLIDIQAIIFIYREYVANGNLDFLSTYKLSQDHLEIFFSAIRAKGGFNNNPTATQFKSAFKRLLVHGELKHLTSGNCIPLSHINILMCKRPEMAINKTSDRNRMIDDNQNLDDNFQEELAEEIVNNDHDYLTDPTRITEYSRRVIIYIAGFVVKALKKQIKCCDCLSLLTAPDKNIHTLQYKKDKGGLHYPSESVIQLCEIAEKAHRAHKITTKQDHMHYLLQTCLKRSIGVKLFSEDHQPEHLDHYGLLIKSICKKYLNVRIHYYTKSLVDKKDNIRSIYTKLILFKGQ